MINPSTVCATVVVDELVRNGVKEVVLAPGSRNAPLSYALAAADRVGRLRLHVRIDERSAGFLALGLAKGSGKPAAVVCTSGTAVANLHPAVIEADRSGVPLLVVSANRPAELVAVGANQTVDQLGIFGSALRLVAYIPAGLAKLANQHWRGRVSRAVAAAVGVGGRPGPVQLDIAFADPLVPSGGADILDLYPGRPRGAPWTRTTTTPRRSTKIPLRARSVLMVIGPTAEGLCRSAMASATKHRIPYYVEAGTVIGRPQSSLSAGSWVMGDTAFLKESPPEAVVVVGRPTLGRSLGRLVARPSVELVVVDTVAEWTDPQHAATRFYCAEKIDFDCAVNPSWGDRLWRADVLARVAVDLAVGDEVTSASVAQTVAASAPGPVFLGSSNAVRDLDLFAGAFTQGLVFANRGAAGIDGTVSTAMGVAFARGHEAEKTVALVGDLTFLHDANGLIIGPEEPQPNVTFVVTNNDGGGIFGLLEQGDPALAEDFERVFGTPHGADLRALCATSDTPYQLVTSLPELESALGERWFGIRVLEVPVDRKADRDRRAVYTTAVSAAIRDLPP